MSDMREVLSPTWEKLSRARQELVWDVHYSEQYAPERVEAAQRALTKWEADHAGEWNASKPWYETRLPSWAEGHDERMRERFKEKQRP